MAQAPEVGDVAPPFSLEGWHDGAEKTFSLADMKGRVLVLALYPHDASAVCTRQMCEYSNGYDSLTSLDAEIWGLSHGDMDSHRRFAEKESLTMPLLVDPAGDTIKAYGGRGTLGTRRATYVIDPDGKIAWTHVSATGIGWKDSSALAEAVAAARGATSE